MLLYEKYDKLHEIDFKDHKNIVQNYAMVLLSAHSNYEFLSVLTSPFLR